MPSAEGHLGESRRSHILTRVPGVQPQYRVAMDPIGPLTGGDSHEA